MLLSPFPILIYSCTEKGQPPILLKSEIDSTSCKIRTLVQTIIMFTSPQIFQQKKTVLLKELIKHFVCVLEKLSHPEGKWFKSENERGQLQLLDVGNGSWAGLAATHR